MSRWAELVARLAKAEQVFDLSPPGHDEEAGCEGERLLFMALASGWLTAFADRDRPDFVPSVNTHIPLVGTNPDFIYGAASIDGKGQYLLTGERGDCLFLQLDIAAGGFSVIDTPGPSLATVDFDDLSLDAQGRFSLLLSDIKPADWAGDWVRLDPSARSLSLRQASYDWGSEWEARIAIERIDVGHGLRPLSEDERANRLSLLADYPARLAGMALGFIADQRRKGLWNRFEHDDWAGRGGVEGQHYYQGLFRLEPGMALLLETELPEKVRYWNVQLNDMRWCTLDWVNHQSSLNGGQASIDDDGRFRAVIALEDPGVANWLDPAGNREGSIMLRWTDASSGPAPTLKAFPLAKLDDHVPAETRRVSIADRQKDLRARRRSAQLRRRW